MKNFDLSAFPGLSTDEAAERLQKNGYNELPAAKKRGIFTVALEVIKEPMFILLVACGVLYLVLGDMQEALLLLGFVFVIMAITFFQERKTENALEALRDLSSPRALVIRNGMEKRIAGREVVPDDIIVISEGDRVPADAVVLQSINLSADESLLTGESVPVRKADLGCNALLFANVPPGGDDQPYIYSGSMIVQGQAIARVIATGQYTELGKIGKALKSIEIQDTPLKKETGRLVVNIAVIGASLCIAVILIMGLVRNEWLQGFLAGLTLAMAMLPEEFPVVLTIFLALGAWRISKRNVLTRRIPAVETLGATTVLCVDKTGTLTLNKMGIGMFYSCGEYLDAKSIEKCPIPEGFHSLVEYGILASRPDPFDPMEKALKVLGELKLSGTEHLHNGWQLVEEYPLSGELLAMSNVWKSESRKEFTISSKGAPEAILDLCHLSGEEKKELLSVIDKMSSEGLRVLGVANATFGISGLPDNQHDFDFRFIGFIGFADPPRPAVPGAIKECYKAGIRVIMITGDHPGTARNIAKQIGLRNFDRVITGQELSEMNEVELSSRIKDTNIFCRVVPEQKLKIVNTLKSMGEIVSMTGDGVNDAPALKSAHIGIAMGGRGTDVARESASLVLLDDDFSSIVGAVKMGRRIFDNLKKAMSYIISIHVPIAGLSLLPLVINRDLILLPVHIVFLELIIDPACSIVFEVQKEEKDLLLRPPRKVTEPLFGKKNVLFSLLQGITALTVSIAVYFIADSGNKGQDEARAMVFVTLILANLGLILSNRSWSVDAFTLLRENNTAFNWIAIGAVTFLFAALFVPQLNSLFRFSYLHMNDLLTCLLAALVSIAFTEVMKLINKKMYGGKMK
ncbi:MAG: cation-translocating P-type ATPase [Bacteroidota bacterium]|jgi:Ca2+-transporting ATPase|nr:cation-translocating P-type ATPase [Ignavibacteria bacterium]MCU7500627.1 cation-translocating P-type ATPase [Ignavibacteria bacterium]MCU7514103.1 cation-translocating P-type ATPase [Ignavibacteria bacterium]MCU7519610.1 cation-translocating P-type ATPase [Ignavibacteria bacterium]MCU7525645.1 cation-translocating P-type ATPase [Ignavibacteria bacterium]